MYHSQVRGINNAPQVTENAVSKDSNGGNAANLLTSKTPLNDIINAINSAKRSGNFNHLSDIVIQNSYGTSTMFGATYSMEGRIGKKKHKYKLRVQSYSEFISSDLYEINKDGFDHLDLNDNYKHTNKFNDGYYQGYYILNLNNVPLVTIGVQNDEAYEYLKSLIKK